MKELTKMDHHNSPATQTGPSPAPRDDIVLPFRAELAQAAGRLVRLGPAIDTIISQHDYPEPVSRLLAEAVTLAAAVGTAIKYDGRFILQAQTDGPVHLVVADYQTPGQLRGYAGYDQARLDALMARTAGSGRTITSEELLGHGHLAMTIDQGSKMQRYQGVVPVEEGGLLQAANIYFERSEQLPTFIRIAVARHATHDAAGNWAWRSGGLIVQHLTAQGGKVPDGRLPGSQKQRFSTSSGDDDDWTRASLLAGTVEAHELLDPLLLPEHLLYRLFHEERVRVFQVKPLRARCRCSRERIERVLKSFDPEEIRTMVKDGAKDGKIEVTCEFCNTPYEFSPDELA